MAVGIVNYPAALDTPDTLIRVRDKAATNLSAAINASQDVIPVANTSSLPSSGAALIRGREGITYAAKTPTSLTGVVRGAFQGDGLGAPESHANGSKVKIVPLSAHLRVLSEAIIKVEELLGPNGSNVGGAAPYLDSLVDVAATTPAAGDVLGYNGTEWRNRPQLVYDVRDWGAVGDGVADDQAAINAAAAAAFAAGGGTVYLPPGTYLVGPSGLHGAVLARSRVRLQGAGLNATTIRLANATNTAVVAFEYDETDMAVADMTLDGNRANQTLDVHGLRFQGNARSYAGRLVIKECRRYGIGVGYDTEVQTPWRDSIVEDVEIFNVGYGVVGDAFDCKRSEHCTIRSIYAHDCVANGLDVRGNHTRISDVYVADVGGVGFSQRMSAYDPPDAGVSLRESRHLFATNITVERCGSHGFWMEAVANTVPGWDTDAWFGRSFLVNAIARDCGGRGYYLSGDRIYAHLTNCLAEGNASHGFQLNATNSATFRAKLVNCTAKGNTLAGFVDVAAAGAGDALVACEAVENATYGFWLAGARHQLIAPLMSGNGSHQILSQGDDASVVGGTVSSGAQIGMRVEGDRTTVQAVSMASTTGQGIVLIAAADATRLIGNNLAGVGGAKITDSGTNTLARDNIGTDQIGTNPRLTADGTVTILAGLGVGTNPASSGQIRMPNGQLVVARNAANTGNVNVIGVNASDRVQIRNAEIQAGPSTVGFFGTAPVVKAAALTAADASTVDATYGAEEAAVLGNVRTRLNEIVARLQAYGLLS